MNFSSLLKSADQAFGLSQVASESLKKVKELQSSQQTKADETKSSASVVDASLSKFGLSHEGVRNFVSSTVEDLASSLSEKVILEAQKYVKPSVSKEPLESSSSQAPESFDFSQASHDKSHFSSQKDLFEDDEVVIAMKEPFMDAEDFVHLQFAEPTIGRKGFKRQRMIQFGRRALSGISSGKETAIGFFSKHKNSLSHQKDSVVEIAKTKIFVADNFHKGVDNAALMGHNVLVRNTGVHIGSIVALSVARSLLKNTQSPYLKGILNVADTAVYGNSPAGKMKSSLFSSLFRVFNFSFVLSIFSTCALFLLKALFRKIFSKKS